MMMDTPELLLDIALSTLLLILAGSALHVQRLYTGIVMFIAFGLLLALAWARLGAADLALAEAAIGAGLTGVLLLTALAGNEAEPSAASPPTQRLASLLPGVLLGILVLMVLIRAAVSLQQGPQQLPELVSNHLDASGVSHPVTAVLLNFRAWDTLLELLVLLLAALGIQRLLLPAPRPPQSWPLLRAWSRILAPLTIMLAGYVLWRGSHAPGGAFQAGALVAAGIVLLRLADLLPNLHLDSWPLRALVLIGPALFIGIASAGAWLGDGWLIYPPGWSGNLILLIEVAATLSIAASLSLLVIGARRDTDK